MIFVTGGTGDVGKEVAAELASKGHQVTAFDASPNPKHLQANEGVKIVRGDVTNLSEVFSAVKESGAKTVVHLASLLTSDAEARPFQAVNVNFVGSATVLEACRMADVQRMIFASSSSVYGKVMEKVTEDSECKPGNIYGALKYGTELYAQVYAKKYGIGYAACRLRVIFGPGQRMDTGAMKILEVRRLIDELSVMKESVFVGEPNQRLEVTHPKDAAHALALAALSKQLEHYAYNVMTGSYTLQRISDAFEKNFPGSKIRFDLANPRRPATAGPSTSLGEYDIQRAKLDLGYEPAYTIEKIVDEVVREDLKIK